MADSENDDRVDPGRPPLHTRFRQGGSPVTPAGAAPRETAPAWLRLLCGLFSISVTYLTASCPMRSYAPQPDDVDCPIVSQPGDKT